MMNANSVTSFDDIAAFESDFALDTIRQSRWKTFIKKKQAVLKIELQEALDVVIKFLAPVVDAIENHEEFEASWNKDDLSWHKK